MITSNFRIAYKKLIEDDCNLTQEEKRVFLSMVNPHIDGVEYPETELIKPEEAARILCVTRPHLINLERAGRLTCIRRTARKIFYIRTECERIKAGFPAKIPQQPTFLHLEN